MAKAAVLLREVSFAYGGSRSTTAPILNIPELQIAIGERVFLYGPSGSGKTTLLSVIAGVIRPQQGSVQVLGHAFDRLPAGTRDRIRGSEIGYVFQSFNLIPYLSVRENIALPCEIHAARRARIPAPGMAGEIERLARHLDISSLLDQPVTRLSTGQQQRVAIARAVLGRPPLVIADEPTSALDEDRRELFLHLLFDLCDDAGSTLLFVSHERSSAQRFSRVLALPEINHAVQTTKDGL